MENLVLRGHEDSLVYLDLKESQENVACLVTFLLSLDLLVLKEKEGMTEMTVFLACLVNQVKRAGQEIKVLQELQEEMDKTASEGLREILGNQVNKEIQAGKEGME